ncbi:TNF receptor-associated factor 6 [Orussus abietinus]|uniref:TNF receptor-associated factor 6 n=1 Tax=Orussus abietinus TaxID=222816 RepID=UPI00062514AD|nr:TNF receptor-associated factor 6 [Orussus abietinus]
MIVRMDRAKELVGMTHNERIHGEEDAVQLESRFECPICLTWLRDPVLTSCGHRFCSQCINSWLEKEGACCPVDSKPLKPGSDLFRDLYTSREISQQRTHCPYQQFGCTVKLSPIDMESHVNQCPYKRDCDNSKSIRCPFKDVGCTENFESQESLRLHLENKTGAHLTMVGTSLPRILSHQAAANATAAESQLWDPPAKNRTSEKDQPSSDWQQLLKQLYERIVVLEQQNQELSASVTIQQKQLTALQASVRFTQEEIALRSYNGIYVWRLSSFQEKLDAMQSDHLKMFYSPEFYTSYNGYKMCARINVSSKDPLFLSVLLHMMKSENDDALDWPFHGEMYFALLHRVDSKKDIRETTTSRPDLEAFKKPVCELNKRSFGYTEFVRISDLEGYIRDDSLLFRIEVRPHERHTFRNLNQNENS